MLYLDAHFHTNIYLRFEGALQPALEILKKHQIYVLSNSTDIESYKETLDIAKKSKYVIPCFGIHPQMASQFIDNLDSLEPFLNQAIAYGEIGLDYLHIEDSSQYPTQIKLLDYFFQKASEQNKMVTLHIDGAEKDAYELLKEYSLEKVIIHGYKGPLDILNKLVDYGCYFSVGGNVINPRFKSIIPDDYWNMCRMALKGIPDERLLTETDGPSRRDPNPPPDAYRNTPDYLFEIIEVIAEARKTNGYKIKELVMQNFRKFINKDQTLKELMGM